VFPLWKRGIKGDFKKNELLLTMKSPLNPSLPKRGIFGNDYPE